MNSRMTFLLNPILCLVSLTAINAYSSGAGPGACLELKPAHDNLDTQTSTSPFAVIPSKTNYTASDKITVTLEARCGYKFIGFLIQARRADNSADRTEVLGTFDIATNTKQLCTNAALTHANAAYKTTLDVTWNAPSTSGTGHIVFKVTFVEVKSKFWQAVTSKVVEETGQPALDLATDSTESPVLDNSNCPIVPTGIKFAQNSECGVTRGCYSDCGADGCSFEVSWNFNGNNPNADFTLKLKASTTETFSQYIAIGFSADNKMGTDSVTECVYAAADSSVDVFNSFNTGRSNTRNSHPKAAITSLSGKLENNVLECSFTRQKDGANDVNVFALSTPYYMFFASGEATAAKAIAQHTSIPLVSSAVIDMSKIEIHSLAQTGAITQHTTTTVESYQHTTTTVESSVVTDLYNTEKHSASPTTRSLVQAHGSLMTIAWVMAASIGLIIARYFKQVWPNSSFLGQNIWFQIHRTCMIVALVATCIAFIIIFADVQDWTESPVRIENAHPYIGVLVTFLCIVNPIMAIFRPHPGSDNRVYFNWAHWAVGTSAYVLGLITVTIGTRMSRAQIADSAVWVMVGFIVWQMLVILCFELIQLLASKKRYVTSYELQTKGAPQQAPQEQPKAESGTLKIGLFLLHVVVVVAFTIAVIVFIAM
ncbi:putative ferric-chelate reductase 1 [Patella vulgata]|uniref:putative ferric-chelate reductase 1 n=1 Tax=Patella vulgata TaxID=6465 RepID=UPI00217F7318|nr:putative ferric-chelate reductase 1 [Patella vulgata]